MKGKRIILFCGVVFSVTLGLVVGQRLSAQAMTVVIGVIAGVATSIPTSLLMVWFMGQAAAAVAGEPAPAAARASEPVEPRIVVVPAPHPQPQPAAAGFGGLAGGFTAYGAQSFAGFQPAMAQPLPAAPLVAAPARRFTVIGGGALDGALGDEPAEAPGYGEETLTWQR
jgi:hypothetical protein